MENTETLGVETTVTTELRTAPVVPKEVIEAVLAREARTKDSVLSMLNDLARDSPQEEPDFGLAGFNARLHDDPFAAAEETVRARRITQIGTTLAAAPNYLTQGNSVIGVPIHPQREGRIETVRAPTQVAVQLSGDVDKEIASLTRQGLRPVNIGDSEVLFASVHQQVASTITHADIKGLLVQLYIAQLGLQGGYRPSTFGRVGFDVRLVDATDRQRVAPIPQCGNSKSWRCRQCRTMSSACFLRCSGHMGCLILFGHRATPMHPSQRICYLQVHVTTFQGESEDHSL